MILLVQRRARALPLGHEHPDPRQHRWARSIREAMDILARELPDAIIYDAAGGSALARDALAKLRAACPHTPIVLVSDDEALTHDAIALGADDLVRADRLDDIPLALHHARCRRKGAPAGHARSLAAHLRTQPDAAMAVGAAIVEHLAASPEQSSAG